MRASVLSRLPIGSCTPLMPRGPHSMPQIPMAVSNSAKCWSVMVGSKIACPIYVLSRNLGLEIVAIHPDSVNSAQRFHPRNERRMQSLHVNGFDMAYLDVGAGPPLVCVHGSLCDFRIWGSVIGPLSERHRVIA